uniref:BTB domain-containing protein n=1 Tax=Globodera pallida TaxID=36090 RepID=A0A183BWG2_GLOPA
MDPAKSQFPSNSGGDQTDQTKDNKYKRSGQIVFRMPDFKEFSEEGAQLDLLSDPVVYINGLPWQILIKRWDDYIGLHLYCDGDETDMAWTCRAAFQCGVVSCKKGGEWLMKEGNLDSFDIFTANSKWGRPVLIKLEEFPKNGLYDEKEDAVTFKAEVIVEEPNGMPGMRPEDALLVNDELVTVNKYLLASYSKFFRTLFFGENANEMPKVQIDDVPDAVANFERLISTMDPLNVDLDDMAWTCRAAFQCGVVSCKKGGEWLMKEGNLDSFDIFTANSKWGRPVLIKLEEFPKNGLYDEKEDAVTFKAEVIVEEPNGMPGMRPEDALLVNDELVTVNKYLLASYSKFFRTLFFGENANEMPKVQIDDVPDAVANFERLISTMDPLNVDLDDECIENVLMLANQFLLCHVEKRCVDFLLKDSKKTAICKFRMAHQCGIIGMKEKILEEMKKEDFSISGLHSDNLSELNKLGNGEIEELRECHKKLFGAE